ncbi:MAG: phosphate ABC transporter permease [Haloarculaceae archaeon]
MTRGDVHRERPVPGWLPPRSDRRRVRRWSAAAALLTVTAVAVVRLLANLPGGGPAFASRVAPLARASAALVPAAGALAVGITTDRWPVRVGLLSVGAFGVLAAVRSAAAVPAAGAVTAGAVLLVVDAVNLADDDRRRSLVGALVAAAVALSLGSATGLLPSPARTGGTVAFLGALALTPVLARPGRFDWSLGGIAAAGVLLVGVAFSYVTGAVALVVGDVLGASLIALAAGVGGATVAASSAAADDRPLLAAGVALVVLAGVPATVPRATAVVLGVALACCPRERARTTDDAGGDHYQ